MAEAQVAARDPRRPSVVHGPPLAGEPGLGALTLGGWLEEVCGRYGPSEAMVLHEAEGETRWSYADLWAQAQGAGRALLACGLGKGARVGVLMTNRPEFVAAVFGAALAGCVATPLSTFSTPAEMAFLLEASACSVLLLERRVLKKDFQDMLLGVAPEIAAATPGAIGCPRLPYLRHVVALGGGGGGGGVGGVESWPDFLARGAPVDAGLLTATARGVSPADPGALFFSSGSTAKPKGILNAHRGVSLQLWRWRRFNHSRSDVRAWSANGFFWSGNFAQALGGALSGGGALVLQRTFDAEEALVLMQRERATMALCWPHQWAQLEAAPNWATADLSSLSYVDERSPLGQHPSVSTRWREPRAAYGNTETFTISTIFEADTPDEVIGASHGKVQPGGVFKIVDPLTGTTVPLGERGEIAVKGPTLMLGYLGVPLDETLDGEGFFRTGDGGWFDAEERLHWEGRLNDIIKTGGANVSPLEVDALLRTAPGVKVSQTVGVPHETLGELVVACIVPHEGASLDEAGLRAFAARELASYKTPRRVLFFNEDELQLTGSAKIKTADLRALAASRLRAEAA